MNEKKNILLVKKQFEGEGQINEAVRERIDILAQETSRLRDLEIENKFTKDNLAAWKKLRDLDKEMLRLNESKIGLILFESNKRKDIVKEEIELLLAAGPVNGLMERRVSILNSTLISLDKIRKKELDFLARQFLQKYILV